MRLFQRVLSLAGLAGCLLLAACGPTTPKPPSPTPDYAPTVTPTPVPPPVDLGGIKTYLTGQTAALHAATTELKAAGQAYYQLAAQSNFNYAALWQNHGAEAQNLILAARAAWTKTSPLYELARGIVASTPSLANFDLIIDSGTSGAEDAAHAAPYDLTLADGRVLPQPGNLFGVTESALWGTWPEYAAPVTADWDRNGALTFGETLPDAQVVQAATAALDQYAGDLNTAAAAWTPSAPEAFSMLVNRLPAIDEYFAAWKKSRFVAAAETSTRDHGVISPLVDMQAYLHSLQVVFETVSPLIKRANGTHDADIRQGLTDLQGLVAGAAQKEQAGEMFTSADADALLADVQNQANSLAGLVTQAAAQLDIALTR